MTSTVNGIGTHLSGNRPLTEEELVKWSRHLPIRPYYTHPEFRIATESFVLVFVPIIPLRTYVFHYGDKKLMSSQYIIDYYPAGKGNVYWEHVKNSWVFYLPLLIIFLTLLFVYFIPFLESLK
jgi:hypothetical protein